MQLSYQINLDAVAFPGQLVDIGVDDIKSAIATEAIPYGVAVALVAGSDYPSLRCALPAAATDTILGISVADQNRSQDPSVAVPTYPAMSAVGAICKGRVYVTVAVDVTAGDSVFAEVGTGAIGTTGIEIVGAKFLSTAVAGGFAVVELK